MPEKKALIVIDMQNDYLWEKKKPMFTYDTDKLVSHVNRAIDAYSSEGCDIIYIRHVLPRLMWGVGFSIKGTEGAELYPGLNVVSDLIFDKNRSIHIPTRPSVPIWKKKDTPKSSFAAWTSADAWEPRQKVLRKQA